MHLTGPVGTQRTEKLQSPVPLWVPNNGRCSPSEHIFLSPALCPVKVRLVKKPMDDCVELSNPQRKVHSERQSLERPWSFPKNLPALLRLAPKSRMVSKQHLCLQGWG